MLLWAGLLVCILRGFSAQLQLWRLLATHRLWRFPKVQITDMAVYQRLARTGPEAMQGLFAQITQALQARFAERYAALSAVPYARFATRILALDHTKLDPVLRKTQVLRDVPVGDVQLLPGALGTLFDLRTQQWVRVLFQKDGRHNVKFGVEELLEGLER